MRWLCLIGVHDWRDGPGHPCIVCGKQDELFMVTKRKPGRPSQGGPTPKGKQEKRRPNDKT